MFVQAPQRSVGSAILKCTGCHGVRFARRRRKSTRPRFEVASNGWIGALFHAGKPRKRRRARLQKLTPGIAPAKTSAAYPLRTDRHPGANYWYFHSNKLNSLLLIESDVLFATVVMLEMVPEVLSYDIVEAADDDGEDEPDAAVDLKVRFDDGHTELWCCWRNRPHANWNPSLPVGAIGRVVTGEDIENARYLFDNALMLSGAITAARSYDCTRAVHALLNKFAVQATVTVADALSIPAHDPGILRAALGQLIADGTLSTDLESQLLSPDSVIKKGGGRSGTQGRALPGTLLTRAMPWAAQSMQQDVPEGDVSTEAESELLVGRRRRLVPLEFRMAEWPTPREHEIKEAKRKDYYTRKRIVEAYRYGATYKAITHRFSVSEAWVRCLVTRCVKRTGGGIHGYYALIPGTHLVDGNVGESSEGKTARGSGSHKWMKLLDQVEGLASLIKACVLGGEAPREGRDLDIDNIHQQVLQHLQEAGFGPGDYPLTNSDRGRDAVARYVWQLADAHLLRYTRIYYGESSEKRAKHTGRGLRRIIRPLRPGSFAQLDYWMVNKFSKIDYPNRFGDTFEYVLPKWYYAVLVDEMTSHVWSGFSSLESNPSVDSALECLDRFMHPEQYRRSDFVNRPSMDPEACFAGELVPALRGTTIDLLRVDNALANLSDSFIRAVVYQFGAAVNFGPTYTWVTRAVVERAIGNIAQFMGRALGRESVVDLGQLRMRLDESCRHHNMTSSARVSYSAPIDVIKNALRLGGFGLIALPLPRETVENSRLLDYVFVARVRCNREAGVDPYIQRFRRRYVGGALERDVWVEARVKRYDVRICEARIINGKMIGNLEPDRDKDILISVRDAMNLGRSGRRRKLTQQLEMAAERHRVAENSKGKRKGKRRKTADPEALQVARGEQSRETHGGSTSNGGTRDSATPPQSVNAKPDLPSCKQEAVLSPWGARQVTGVVVSRRPSSREGTLRPWSSPNTSSSKKGGSGRG